MSSKYVVMVAALAVAGFLALAFSNGWFWFKCEGFGCTGIGILYLMICALVVVAFFIGGILFGPAPRFLSGLFTGGIALLAMTLSLGIITIEAQWKISQDREDAEEACTQYPKLCPKKSVP